MTFQQLKYIIEISRSHSITAAAQKLFISQPSLSKSVKELETELGITILERRDMAYLLRKVAWNFKLCLSYCRSDRRHAGLLSAG